MSSKHMYPVGEANITAPLPSWIHSWKLCSKSDISKRNTNQRLLTYIFQVCPGDNSVNGLQSDLHRITNKKQYIYKKNKTFAHWAVTYGEATVCRGTWCWRWVGHILVAKIFSVAFSKMTRAWNCLQMLRFFFLVEKRCKMTKSSSHVFLCVFVCVMCVYGVYFSNFLHFKIALISKLFSNKQDFQPPPLGSRNIMEKGA